MNRYIIVIYIFFPLISFSQEVNDLQFTHISTKNGLNSTYVRKILQDPLGFMWIATQDGLSRYNGVNFVKYNSSEVPKHSISGSDVRDLLVDSANGFIWVITSYGGIDAIDLTSGNVVFRLQQSHDNHLENILFNSFCLIGHNLFIGSSKGLFFLDVETKKLFSFSLKKSDDKYLSSLWINNILCDRDKNIWLFCNNSGIRVLSSLNLKLLYKVDKSSIVSKADKAQLFFYDCCETKDGIVCCTNEGLKVVSVQNGMLIINQNAFPFAPNLTKGDVYACRTDKTGNIWAASNSGLFKLEPSRLKCTIIKENISRDDWKWVGAVFNIFFDSKNDLWLGCQQGLAFAKNQPVSFESYFKAPGSDLSINQVYYINPVDDTLLFICATDGLYRINRRTKRITDIAKNDIFFHAYIDSYKRTWISSNKGTFILSDTHFVELSKIYSEFRNLGKLVLNSHVQFSDSLIFFGTENKIGVVVWNIKERHARLINSYSRGLCLKEDVVNNLFQDYSGNVWVLGDNSVSILKVKLNQTEFINTYNSSKKKYYSIFFDASKANGNYFVASYGNGVLVYDANFKFVREISVKNGLANNGVYKVIPYADSILLVSTNNGLSKINLATGFIKNYYGTDGLQSDNFEERAGNSFGNKIYAGGVNGFTVIDPQYFTTNTTPPKFYFTNIKTETTDSPVDTSNLALQQLSIPNNWLQTNISFVGLNYANPERVTYQYRIKERSLAWGNLGTQNFVNLIGLNPGTYTLEVKAANEDGVWCLPKSLTLTFLPKWYQTLWFNIAVLLAVTGLVYAFYRYRIRQIKKQQKIRVDIASDLHDDIGSALNTVKVFTHLAKREMGKEEHINQIEESLTQATAGLRDMIWILDDSQDTLQEILERIKKFALPVAMANGIKLECFNQAPDDEQAVSKTNKRNLLLIAKECINNCIKYAGCTNIQVLITQYNKKVQLVIKDNGKGFNLATTPHGNGMGNIHYRAKQMNAVAEIISAEGEGTLIRVTQR